MRGLLQRLTGIVVLVMPLCAGQGAAAETVRMGGTGSATEVLRRIGGDFMRASGIDIEVIPSLGSTGAIRALADGRIDIAVSGRALTENETAAGLRQSLVLRTAFVFATSKPDPNGLKSSDLPAIYATARPTWADGTPIRVILRPRPEADTALMGQLFPGMDTAIEAARRRAEVPVAATDQDNTEIAKGIPGSLIGMSLTQYATEVEPDIIAIGERGHVQLRLNLVPIDGVMPTLANFESGTYPYTKRLYFLLGPRSAPAGGRFLDYLRSRAGMDALRQAGALPDSVR